MANHGVMIPSKIMAKDIDSLVRSVKSAVDLDNGNIFTLGAVSSVASEKEVFIAATPTATLAATPVGIWIAEEPEVVMSSGYKGLDPNPQHFYNVAGDIFTATKMKKYDIRRFTDENFANTRTTETFANVVAGSNKFTWASTQTVATVMQLVEVTNIAIPAGSPGSNRVVAYRMETIAE